MHILGLIFEIIILAAAIFGYLFTRGMFSSKDPAVRKKADIFRKENGWWLRIGCILIIALMSVEVFLNIQDLVSK